MTDVQNAGRELRLDESQYFAALETVQFERNQYELVRAVFEFRLHYGEQSIVFPISMPVSDADSLDAISHNAYQMLQEILCSLAETTSKMYDLPKISFR